MKFKNIYLGRKLGCLGIIIGWFGLINIMFLLFGAGLCCIGIVYSSFEEELGEKQ